MQRVSIRGEKWRPPERYFDIFLKWLIKFGPVPRHIAFIMDGNRRFAVQADQEKSFGHSKGYGKLESVIEWCSEIGVQAVTTYAFSIENFKRSADEIEYLMKLAEEKANFLLENRDSLDQYKICVVFTGNLSYLPSELQNQCFKIMEMTRNNKAFICNICLSYTSGDELAAVASSLANDVKNGHLATDEISENLVDFCLNTSPMGVSLPPVDILIRTSGEKRLSDFLLWQTSFAMFTFVDTLWPDFSIFDFASVILRYKWHSSTLQKIRNDYLSDFSHLSENQKESVDKYCRKRLPSVA